MLFKVKKYKNANTARTVRFTENLFETLNKISVKQDVSFNSLVLQCCEFALRNMEPEQKTDKGSGPPEKEALSNGFLENLPNHWA